MKKYKRKIKNTKEKELEKYNDFDERLDKAFLDGYKYAIQMLVDGLPK